LDTGIIIGIVVAFAMILGGNVLEGGHLSSIVNAPAFMIVIGGTVGAVIVQFPLPIVKQTMGALSKLMKPPHHDPEKILEQIVDFAQRARKDGILALEKVASEAHHPFLAKGIMMAVDGSDSNAIRATLEVVISQDEAHQENSAKVLEAGGGYCPTIGIIGAVLGLIHVMSNLSDINKVGTGIAGAFVATIYGVAASNIFFLPLAGRIKVRLHEETQLMELMLSGVLAIQEGLNPKLVRERLSAYVTSHEKAGAAAGAKAPA
jgi:chemotaxis protein MotA